MYRPYSCVFLMLLLSGCATTDDNFLPEASPDPFGEEQQALFDQPYIDPLTDYLIEYQGDTARQTVLREIRQERNQRCRDVASEYAREPATEQVLERYNTGYAYSCPEQVADFEERVKRQLAETAPQPEPEPEPESKPEPDKVAADTVSENTVSDQALSDCYLLTTIRNFSAARKACRQPAENGDVRSQANMAKVAHAFEDYPSAHKWAEKAAPNSGDAAFILARMYADGHGVSQNMDQAVYWYEEAARQGHKKAQAALDRHREGLPAGDI